jgi:hypothetical protein
MLIKARAPVDDATRKTSYRSLSARTSQCFTFLALPSGLLYCTFSVTVVACDTAPKAAVTVILELPIWAIVAAALAMLLATPTLTRTRAARPWVYLQSWWELWQLSAWGPQA